MYVLSFGRWSRAAGRWFIRERIYRKDYIWTPFVKLRNRQKPDPVQAMRDLIKVQGYNGNWDYDPYMHGMYNGMELMLAMAEGREPVFREAPQEWRKDVATFEHPIAAEAAIEPTAQPSA